MLEKGAAFGMDTLGGALLVVLFGVVCLLLGYALGRLTRSDAVHHAQVLEAYRTFILRATELRLCLWRNFLSPSAESNLRALEAWYAFLAAQAAAAVHADAPVAQALCEVRRTLRKAVKDDPHVRLAPALERLVAAVKRQLGYSANGTLAPQIDEQIDRLAADLAGSSERAD